MLTPIAAAIKRIGLVLGGIVAMMASISGVIATIQWATDAFGAVPVVVVGTFVAGAVVMHGIDYACALHARQAVRTP